MTVPVVKGDVVFDCHSEEQLQSFLADGYVRLDEQPKDDEKKPAKKAK